MSRAGKGGGNLSMLGRGWVERSRGDFPGGPVVETRCFHCRGRGFDSWSEN